MEKLLFNKGLISDLIFLGTADEHDFFPENMSFFFHSNIFFQKKIGLPRFLATIVNLPNIYGALNNSDFVWHNSEPSY